VSPKQFQRGSGLGDQPREDDLEAMLQGVMRLGRMIVVEESLGEVRDTPARSFHFTSAELDEKWVT
jgi:hypothetical protein